MNPRNHVVELLGAFALNALDEAEAERVRAHLADCAACRAELVSFTEVAGHLASLSLDRPPSPGLRGRVLAAVEREAHPPSRLVRLTQRARRFQWAWAALAVGVVFSQTWLLASLFSMRARLDQQAEIQKILLSSDETPVTLRPPDPASPARGIYRFEPDLHRGLISYYRLRPPGTEHAYQCWFEFATGQTTACGRLPLEPDGSGLLLLTLPNTQPIRLRVTLEARGASSPTGPTVLAADLSPDNH